MTSHLNPYLSFDSRAREAMEFYRSVFGGDLQVMTFGEFGSPEGVDPDGVMHAMLRTETGFMLMGSDVPPGMERTVGDNITVSLSGDDREQLRGYWTALSEGAQIHTELAPQMWGDEFGQLTDRFGVPWLVDIAPEESSAD